MLINIAHRVNVVGGGVRLINVAEKFKVLFDMLGLETCLPIINDYEEALNSFGESEDADESELSPQDKQEPHPHIDQTTFANEQYQDAEQPALVETMKHRKPNAIIVPSNLIAMKHRKPNVIVAQLKPIAIKPRKQNMIVAQLKPIAMKPRKQNMIMAPLKPIAMKPRKQNMIMVPSKPIALKLKKQNMIMVPSKPIALKLRK